MRHVLENGQTLEIVAGDKVRTFGGWYRHDVVTLDGTEIGRIQVRRRNKRTDTTTASSIHAGAVLGRQVEWLLSQAGVRVTETTYSTTKP